MKKYALDTDITSFYLKGNTKLIDRINNEVKGGTIVIRFSMLVFVELHNADYHFPVIFT